jgi:probable O-glycosylation ligase (exosortase A-associated)
VRGYFGVNQLVFMVVTTLVGTLGVYVYNPFLGVAVYYLFAIMRPQYMWVWALPEGISWSYYVALATMSVTVVKPAAMSFTRTHWILVCWALWIVVAYVNALNKDVGYFHFYEYVKIFVMFIVSARLLKSFQELWILLLIGALSLGYISYEINFNYFIDHRLDIFHYGYGGLDNNGAGLMLAMGVPMCYFVWEGSSSRFRWGFLILIPVIIHAVLMTYSRGAMVSLIAVIPLFLLRSRKRKFLLLWSVGIALLLPYMAGKEIRARFSSLEQSEADESANSRRASWAAAWGIAKDYPIFGVGVRNANLLAKRYGADVEGRTIHSQYLQAAADTGFVGLGIYCTLLVSTWLDLRQARLWARSRTDAEGLRVSALSAGAEGAMIVFGVGAFFLSLELFEIQYYIVLLAAQMAGLVQQRQTEEQPSQDEDAATQSEDLPSSLVAEHA